jgi:hypothetical protein
MHAVHKHYSTALYLLLTQLGTAAMLTATILATHYAFCDILYHTGMITTSRRWQSRLVSLKDCAGSDRSTRLSTLCTGVCHLVFIMITVI